MLLHLPHYTSAEVVKVLQTDIYTNSAVSGVTAGFWNIATMKRQWFWCYQS